MSTRAYSAARSARATNAAIRFSWQPQINRHPLGDELTIEGDLMFVGRIKHTMPEIDNTIKLLVLNSVLTLLDQDVPLRQRN